MNHVIGLDIGSSAAKAGLFDAEGRLLACSSRRFPTEATAPGHREQDPRRWWSAACEGNREVTAHASGEDIAAIGCAGHISSLTFVDRQGEPLRPSVAFQDQRAVAEVAELQARFSRKELAEELALDLPPAPTWPLPRLLWFRRHEPSTLESTHHLLQAKDYINFCLTGEFASDVSSCRGLVNLDTGQVAKRIFSELGLDARWLPKMAAPDAVIGTVSAKAAEATGLRPGIPVVAGWNDLNAAVLGIGAIDDGQYFNITGTSEHIGRVTTDCAARAPGLICASYLPGRRLLYGVTTCGGGSIEWYRRVTRHPLEDLLVQAEKASLQNDPLLFLPYLDGERAPIWDPQASGAFIGLRTTHGQGHLVRSILEGVCFSLRQILEQVPSPSAATPGAITVAGGTARSSVWNQIKADVLNRRLDLPAHLQAGVLGAAILAAVGVKRYPDAATAAARMVRCAGRFEARTTQASELALRYAIYCEAYPALRSVFAGLRHARA